MKKETQYRSYVSNAEFKSTAGLKDLFHIEEPDFSVNGKVTVCRIKVEDWTKGYSTFNVVGLSRCHNEDEFSEEMGRNLAEHRALAKAYRVMGQRLKEISTQFMSIGKGYEELYQIVEEKSNRQKNFLSM